MPIWRWFWNQDPEISVALSFGACKTQVFSKVSNEYYSTPVLQFYLFCAQTHNYVILKLGFAILQSLEKNFRASQFCLTCGGLLASPRGWDWIEIFDERPEEEIHSSLPRIWKRKTLILQFVAASILVNSHSHMRLSSAKRLETVPQWISPWAARGKIFSFWSSWA